MDPATKKSEAWTVRAVDKLTVGLAALLFVQCLAWLTYVLIVAPEQDAAAAELAGSLSGPYVAPAAERDLSAAIAPLMVAIDWWGGLGVVKRSVGRRSVGFTVCAVAHTVLLAWSASLAWLGYEAMWLPVVAALPVVLLAGILRLSVRMAPPRVA